MVLSAFNDTLNNADNIGIKSLYKFTFCGIIPEVCWQKC